MPGNKGALVTRLTLASRVYKVAESHCKPTRVSVVRPEETGERFVIGRDETLA
jgi:hypothetical protein